jgi:hypothetical protein
MKKLMVMGAMIGFGIGIIFGVLQECSWPSILWRGSVAAFVAGMLLRWWGRLWVQSLRESLERQTIHHDPKPNGATQKS